jgi:anaerobic selenocysteine-containing dehydrogenase
MMTPAHTVISTQYHQVKTGGDTAAMLGICKAVIHADDRAMELGEPRVLDVAFIETHTIGFEAFADYVRAASWGDIERVAGLPRADLEAAAAEYMRAKAVMAHYGMGITQHRQGVQNVRMLCNLLFLRGNIGKPGAGPSPVRGHSNVQGQRTVGITEKPELAPLDKLASQFNFEPPREKGMNIVEAFEAMLDGQVSAVINLGGNLVRSVPDRFRIEPAWRELELVVNVATKLNRSHLVHGKKSYILPCLSRIEIDTRRAAPRPYRWKTAPAAFTARAAWPSRPRPMRAPSHISSQSWRSIRSESARPSTGVAGATTMRWCATRSRRRIPRPFTTSTKECGLPADFRAICRRANANGKRRAARLSSPCLKRSAKIPTCPSASRDRCGS